MRDRSQFKTKLMALRQEVTQRINAIDKECRHEGMSADWAEQATERENDEVLQSLGNTAQQELAMISTALKKIETGEFFICSACGEDILLARLELLPFSSLCVKCADKLEEK